jgi:succinyl-CoA synthetase beta subunit
MNLHEYQAKAVLRDYGFPFPKAGVAVTAEGATARAKEVGGSAWAVKAQVHAGRRGKAGGVRIVHSPEEAGQAAAEMLGTRIVTEQTGRDGLPIRKVYVEEALQVAREIYAAVLINRSQAKVSVIVSAKGGEDVETALTQSDHIFEMELNGAPDESQLARLAEFLGLPGDTAAAVADLLARAKRAFIELDASLIELNPLVLTTGGALAVLDVKMVLDDNALMRHPNLVQLRDEEEVDPQELEAGRYELNYVRLDGDIGVLVTGAGLGLAVLDLIKEGGGDTANFMDVRPVASRDQVAEGFRLLLTDARVSVVLVVAMGGGILRCDTIAEGLAAAIRRTGSPLPVVYHAAGTGKEISEMVLRNQGFAVTLTDSIEEAAHEALRISRMRAA